MSGARSWRHIRSWDGPAAWPAAAVVLLLLATAWALGQAGQASSAPAGYQWAEEDGEVPYAVAGSLTGAGQPVLTLRLEAAEGGDHLLLQVKDGQAQFFALQGNKPVPIGAAGKLQGVSGEGTEFTVQRTGWRLSFICGGRVICRGWSLAEEGAVEKVGWQTAGGTKVEDARIQPLGPIEMSDDFMRVPESGGTWEPEAGKWQQRALREDAQASAMDASKSANPFSYYGEAAKDGPGITLTGYWFWTDYRISAAVRGDEDSVIGLVACYHDRANYLAVRWTCKTAVAAADKLQLLAIADGKEQVLAEARQGFLAGQWYRLALGWSDGLVTCWVDDEPKLLARVDLFGQGRAGLMSAGREGAFFDDVEVQDWEEVADELVSFPPGKWQLQGGQWTPGPKGVRVTSKSEAMATTGRPQWRNYIASVHIAGTAAAAGLVLGAGGEEPVLVAVRPKGAAASLAVLSRADANGWQELSAVQCQYSAKTGALLEASLEDGFVIGRLGTAVVEAFVPSAEGGRVGLYTSGATDLVFKDFTVRFPQPPAPAHLVKEFTDVSQHFEMAEWASRRRGWVNEEDLAKGVNLLQPRMTLPSGPWWSKGDYYADYVVTLPVRNVGNRDFTQTVTLDAEPGWENAGVTVAISGRSGEKTLYFEVRRGEERLGEARVEVTAEETQVACERRGAYVVIRVDESVVWAQPALPAPGRRAQPGAEGERKGEGQ
ncbi:MAG: hypothetical protein N2512_09385 [Armatimonadetes bacterium]|nr:hypothetical protein [Armatimonadota bacterium]